MIVSGTFAQTTVPIVHDIPQINTIYVFSQNQAEHEGWVKVWPKIKGVFTDIAPICKDLQEAAQEYDQNMISISFIATCSENNKRNLDQLDSSFMYTQIMKEILLTIDFKQHHINEFSTFCRQLLAANPKELQNLDKFEREYREHVPIWWYTYPCFLYSMLNRSLRMMEVDLIIRMGFFIRDLHSHIAKLHAQQFARQPTSNSFTVYRGQGLSMAEFDQLTKIRGGLLSFNNFVSTSKDRQVSLRFIHKTIQTSNLVGILFVMKIDPSIPSAPFADIHDVSHFKAEKEILLSMHSIFRIGLMKQIDENNRLWQVDLTLTSDNDPELHVLTEQMRKDVHPHLEGWSRLSMLLIKLGQFDKAQDVCNILLDETTTGQEKATIYNMLGEIKYGLGEYTNATTYYQRSIEIKQKIPSPTDIDLSLTYNNVGMVYSKIGDYSNALSYCQKALEIRQKYFPSNDPHLADSYNNIGSLYSQMGDNSNALSYYQKALEIIQKTLPSNHPHLAISYNSIGSVYDNMGDYSNALSYYQKVLEIAQKTLPSNHPFLATAYNNISLVYNNMGDYFNALSSLQKALEIRKKSLPSSHPDLANCYESIASVYNNIGDYSNALSFHQKALEIQQKTLPSNHSQLANSYNNIGLVYINMGDYSNALSSLQKALEILQKILPSNHPYLARSYNNMGSVYNKMGDYSDALSSHQKALEIQQKTLPSNHPHLGTSYNNIGLVYDNMGDYSKALSFYERALSILQRSVPANHPNLVGLRKNLDCAKRKCN
ncbi:unnamed protein product [Rotaria sp. Silwood2]|nr:unnamed protein product [Rotaria sp. Silwood2]CAF4013842.1 unnamed protein product [Rotaria sp. Silwood2]